MRLLKVLAVLSALSFLACVTAYGAGGDLGSTKSGHLPRPATKDAGTRETDVYLYSTKAGPMPVPQEEQPQQQAPQQQRARK